MMFDEGLSPIKFVVVFAIASACTFGVLYYSVQLAFWLEL